MDRFHVAIFLPAAGLGERLRPATNHLPKPLFPVLGRPLIETILDRLTAVCDGEIGINLHWKPELLRDWAAASPWADRIRFFPEESLLGTGGALVNAASLLSASPFIVHNADILLDCDLKGLIEAHLANNNIATLATHRLSHLSNVVIDDNGLVIDVENPGASRPDPTTTARKVAYTGVAVYSPEIFRFLPDSVSHTTVAWIAASQAGRRVQSFDVTGAYWSDIGTPATYATAVLDALRARGETVYRDPHAVCDASSADGYLALERGSHVARGSRMRNCIVMPGALVSGDHENSIIGPDYTIRLSESEMQPSAYAARSKTVAPPSSPLAAYFAGTPSAGPLADALLIGMGGSDRRYYRIKTAPSPVVLMECGADDSDYGRHIEYTRFFAQNGLPVPRLIAVDEQNKKALFEDLGDMSLYSWTHLHGHDDAERLYRAALDALLVLHGPITDRIDGCPLLRDRIFDYDYFRWETAYFLDRFVIAYASASIANRPRLDDELHLLATRAASYPRVAIHRDFQSQNVMIDPNGLPRIIDYQGARMAPAGYDLASILWDPYVRLDDGLRDRLVDHYINGRKGLSAAFDAHALRESLLPCRLQRHMQALGAYGFLSIAKGKRYFERFVPEALRLLRAEVDACRQDYPELYGIVSAIADRHTNR